MEPERLPPVNPELVTWLERVFPDKCPDYTDTERAIWMAVGATKVVRKLRDLSKRQNTTVLADSTTP